MTVDKIIEKFSTYFASVGLSKTYGRLFGIFITSSEPISMGALVKLLGISKSTASTELRRLVTMGVIEKVSISNERADFYQLKKDLWFQNLLQKVQDIQRLKAIIEKIPMEMRQKWQGVETMFHYCSFIEQQLIAITKKYEKLLKEENLKC
jgi:DNA-binding transcriptional regulator GbsR (MarR family)